jgi:hypothetical protein
VYQFRLSTLLLAFVVVWSALAVFGGAGGIVASVLLLAAAAYIRSAESRIDALGRVLVVFLCGLCLFGLLLPAVSTHREFSRQMQCANNLKQIGLALQNYKSVYNGFPPAVVADKQGNALHSWRTLILPYYCENALYNAFKLPEPWNSPNNSKAAATLVPVFCCSSDRSIIGRPMTSYVAVTGPGTVWDDRQLTGKPRAMVVEVANSGIQWAEPRDLTLDEACRGAGGGSGPAILSQHAISGGFFFQDEFGAHVLLSDGSVRFIPAGLPPETLRGLFTGDQQAWKACDEDFPTVRHRRINWTNCTALAVLVISYAVLVFRPRDKRPAAPGTPPTCPEQCQAQPELRGSTETLS